MLRNCLSVAVFFLLSSGFAQIRVIMTTAQMPVLYEERKEQYLRSFRAIRAYGFDPWVIEAKNITSSFFDELSRQVLYPQQHNEALRNKGLNETLSMLAALPYLPFDDEDIVIKLTGRYYLYDRFFIDTIEAASSDYDAFVCYGKHFVSKNHLFTGCFALRWKHFKKLVREMDYDRAEREYISTEQLYAEFIEGNHLRIKIVDPVHVMSKVPHEPEKKPEWVEICVW